MDYEKKYNEALKRAKAAIDVAADRDLVKGVASTIFPELRESEDERIRKWIASYIHHGVFTEDEHPMALKAVEWLEKQKEQKPVDKEITLTNFEEVLNTFLFDFANSPIEDCEPKEYTKKHSAEILKAAYTELNAQLKQDIFEAQQEGRREGYEAAKAEQKPAEWSEEDEKNCNRIIRFLEPHKTFFPTKETKEEMQNWLKNRLKSLRPVSKESLQSHWKPSEEQMRALNAVIKHLLVETPERHRLEELYEQLNSRN